MERIHATCVAWAGSAVLLRGVPGSGKSDLALRLIDGGWDLVADDYSELHLFDGCLCACAPNTIKGLLEVRGLGLVRLPCVARAEVAALFDLKPRCEIERLPEPATTNLLGISIPCYAVHAFEASAPAKVRLALKAQRENLLSPS